ncbi:hypothetical protein MYX07_00475 [Patescibacteria group bacterium AH-259-L07]|nr:hypothetical protein [Patescibacteria group bacterium AH-259-L07]
MIGLISIFLVFLGCEKSPTGPTPDDKETPFWQQTQGYDGIVRSLAVSPTNDVFAGTENNGALRSTDNGETWGQTGLVGYKVLSLAINSDADAFAGTYYDGVFRSGNDTYSFWTQTLNKGFGLRALSIAINSTDDVFVGTSGSYIYHWSTVDRDWIQHTTGLTNRYIHSLTINSDDDLLAGTDDGTFRSTDNGKTWGQTGLVGYKVLSLATHSNGDVFAGTESNGTFRSTDNGETWEQINAGLTNSPIWALTITSNSYLLAGTEDGIFRSTEPLE